MSRARDRRRAKRKAKRQEDDELQFGYWFVAFFDLLGIRERYLATDRFPTNGDEVAALRENLKNSMGVVQKMRAHLARFQAGMNYPGRDERLKALPPNVRAEANALWQVRAIKVNVSDAIMLACPLAPDDAHFPLRGIYDAFHACATLMLISLADGHPIRGGLDVGTGVLDGGELFGAAPVKAYILESKLAGYPRLLVGDTLVARLVAARDGAASPGLRGQVEPGVADLLLGFLKRDTDGRWIVDYAGPTFRTTAAGVPGAAGLIDSALAFARNQRDEFAQRKDDAGAKLAGRYRALVRYLESSAPSHGG